LADKTRLSFQLYDFTPRSKIYYENLVNCHTNGLPVKAEGSLLESKKFDINRFQFTAKGLTLDSKNIEFYPPLNPTHVSFSSVNNGNEPILFPTLSLNEIIEKIDINNRSIIKLDIEGSEFELLRDQITNASIFTFDIVLLELDFLRYCSLIQGFKYLEYIFKNSHQYKLFYNDGYNVGFLKNTIL
jgi:FkbM family methyltransferase